MNEKKKQLEASNARRQEIRAATEKKRINYSNTKPAVTSMNNIVTVTPRKPLAITAGPSATSVRSAPLKAVSREVDINNKNQHNYNNKENGKENAALSLPIAVSAQQKNTFTTPSKPMTIAAASHQKHLTNSTSRPIQVSHTTPSSKNIIWIKPKKMLS